MSDFFCNILRKTGRFLPDRILLPLKYFSVFGRFPDLKNPKRFTEVVLWSKLFDRNPLYHVLVDKADVKPVVSSLVGAEHVIPTIGVWDSVDEVDWNALPEKFVIKCTHDSGSTIVCKDKRTFDIGAAKASLDAALKTDYYKKNREWCYEGVKPRILAEEYIGDAPSDYKFFCFDGTPCFMFIAQDRGLDGEETKFDFFDMDFNHLDVRNGHPNANRPIAEPQSFERMKSIAADLSQGIPQVRIDLYDIGGKIYFGEYTFYHWGGFVKFDPDAMDERFGSYFKKTVIR